MVRDWITFHDDASELCFWKMCLDDVFGLCFWMLCLDYVSGRLDDVCFVNVSRMFITCCVNLLVVCVGNLVSTSEKTTQFFYLISG